MPWRGKHPAGYEDFDQALDDSVVYDDFEEESGGWVKPSSESYNMWRCSICTLDNPEMVVQCEVCGSFRNSTSYQAEKKKGAFAKPSVLAESLFAPLPHMKLKKRNVIQKVINRMVGSNPMEVPRIFEACYPETHIEPFKFDGPSPDDLVLQSTFKSSAVKVPSKNVASSKRPSEEKESKAKVAEELIKEDAKNIVPQTIEMLKSLDLHTDEMHKKPSIRTRAAFDLYKPESWMLEAFKQDIKQSLHLAIVGHVDAGKSTLMGRFLHILGMVSQKEMHKYEKEAKQIGKGSFSYAWVLDESAEERLRGVTMTVAVAHFETPRFRVVLLDSPGHRDFVPSMISGASQADAAILVVDASIGAFEAGMEAEGEGAGQTKEHTQLIRSLGVEQIIVAVNKMDSVDYFQGRFDSIKSTLHPFLRKCGFKDSGIKWVPLSAMENQNLVTSPSHEKLKIWFSGPCLIEAIDLFEPPIRNIEKPLRMSIAETLKSRTLGQAAVSGKLEAGAVRVGSKVLVMPASISATVKAIEQNGERCTCARAGDNIDIGLQGVDPGCLIQGGVLCHPNFPVPAASKLELKVIILETSAPLLRGSQVVFHCHHAKEPAKITQLTSLLDQKGQVISNKKPRCLLANQRAIIEVTLERSMCIEEYSRCKVLGRITLRDRGKTLAVGIVTQIIECEDLAETSI